MSGSQFSPQPKRAFSPEDVAVLAAAYETICDAARLRESSQMVRDLVASKVINMANTGERDPLRIVDRVMAELGLSIRCAA